MRFSSMLELIALLMAVGEAMTFVAALWGPAPVLAFVGIILVVIGSALAGALASELDRKGL